MNLALLDLPSSAIRRYLVAGKPPPAGLDPSILAGARAILLAQPDLYSSCVQLRQRPRRFGPGAQRGNVRRCAASVAMRSLRARRAEEMRCVPEACVSRAGAALVLAGPRPTNRSTSSVELAEP